MSGSRPSILVIDSDRNERTTIARLLRQAGFAVVATARAEGAIAAVKDMPFSAAVVGLPAQDGIELVRQVRCRQPRLPAVLVIEPATMATLDSPDAAILISRPFDPPQLLGCVFELVLRGDGGETAPRYRDAAEFGIIAAKLACLDQRRASVTAVPLTQDLAR